MRQRLSDTEAKLKMSETQKELDKKEIESLRCKIQEWNQVSSIVIKLYVFVSGMLCSLE